MAEFKDHFSVGSAGYAAHRPTYPPALAEWLADESPARNVAWDAGCGSGQLSALLGGQFEKVIATDASAEQIRNAKPHPRVEYRTEPAERSSLGDGTADCVTVAQAAHWLDLPAFYKEARRVGRPNALLALITYERTKIDATVDPVIAEFYGTELDSYWPPERRHVETEYRDLPFPFEPMAVPRFDLEAAWDVEAMLGYVGTWSAVKALERAGEGESFRRFGVRLRDVWGMRRRHVRWPVTVIAGRIAG
jgi:SAM-dependent methyltransferase